MKKNILVILLFILILPAIFFYWKKEQIESDISYINGLLYQLDIEMDVLEHSKKNYTNDQYLEDKLTHLIVNKLLVLSHANPPLDKLRGTPLIALNRLIDFNKSNPINFKLGESEYISQSIENYLNKIEDQVKIEINKRDKILQDPLKKEFKEKWGIVKETD
jgi:hypothetical protein